MAQDEATATPWHAAYPPPRHTSPASITPSDLLRQMKSGGRPGVDFLLIDLRRTDHEGGTIRGSLNLPAQTLYDSIPTLYLLCSQARISSVIFYCGSSRGRGTRAAGWLDDLLQDRGDSAIRSMVLLGGLSGWASGGEEFIALMDGYDESRLKIKDVSALLA